MGGIELRDPVQDASPGQDQQREPAARERGSYSAQGGASITYGTPAGQTYSLAEAADLYIADLAAKRQPGTYPTLPQDFGAPISFELPFKPLEPQCKPVVLDIRKRVEGSPAEEEIRWLEGASERLSAAVRIMMDNSGPALTFPMKVEACAEIQTIANEIKRRAAAARANL